MAEIDREQLLHVASLARLELREDELERLGVQLNDILAAVSKVSELDLADVPPTPHPLDIVNVWAEDEPHECLTLDEAFANAPEREGNYFKVPAGSIGGKAADARPTDRAASGPGAGGTS